jgi:hypothetical protein
MDKQTLVKMSIKSVTVVWSESNEIQDETTHTVEQFLDVCKAAASSSTGLAVRGGYDKTKFVVTFVDGSTETHRIDITPTFYNPLEVIAFYLS